MRHKAVQMSELVYSAHDIIKRFKQQVNYDGKVIVHETDWLYKPDIAIVDRELKISEYEIKVSLQDLRKELDYIEFVIKDQLDGIDPFYNTFTDYREDREIRQQKMQLWRESMPKKYHRDDNKYRKHLHYLYNQTPRYGGKTRVNRYYFLIPKPLYEAEKARIDKILPYGVVDALTFRSLKKCQSICKDTLDARTLFQIALNISHKVDTENE